MCDHWTKIKSSDEELRRHINALVQKEDDASREELIRIADYVRTEIVGRRETVSHLAVVNAILCSDIEGYDYAAILQDFERVIMGLAKNKQKKDIELAPCYYTLWGLTDKGVYLDRFEKTVRQCYQTLAKGRHYPDLGIDVSDRASVAAAIRFLEEYRMNVWIVNDKYDVDKVIAKYKTA